MGVLSALIFILWGFCPMVLLSILAFLCPPTWSHDENVDCPHLYHVITWTEIGSYTLIVGVLKYFLFLGVLSALIALLWNRIITAQSERMGEVGSALVRAGTTSPMPEPIRVLSYSNCHEIHSRQHHLIVHLDCRCIKIFSLLGVLSALIFILWGFCPMVLLSILVFLCPPTWSHDENVDCPHLYHVITWPEMGSYTLIVGVLKYFLFWGFLSALIFILWFFCPMVLLSIWAFLCPPTWSHLRRMLIVHTCIMWSYDQKWDRTPWLLEY